VPIIFDWTLLEAVGTAPDPASAWPTTGRARFVAVGSGNGLAKKPDDRKALWEGCSGRADFSLVVAPPGWRMAGIIRERQVAAARLNALNLGVATDVDALAAATVALIDDLRPPTAFYVRLLASGEPEYPAVERFFRDVVDPVIVERGFTPREMGREAPETAFMNAEIFTVLHRAALVVADLTAMRTNCLMELGYGLG